MLLSRTELAQAATRAAKAATTVDERVGSKGGMASGMESASKVLKNPDVFNGEDAASFMGWKLNFETWWHMVMNASVSFWEKSRR